MIRGALIAALALAIPAQASPKEVYRYTFVGRDSCGDWTENRAKGDSGNQGLEGWVMGFITGHNVYNAGDGLI